MAQVTYQRQCMWCGQDFEATREDATFHSVACKQAYWRWKHGLDLELARAKVALQALANYTTRVETGDQAWTAIVELRDYCNWYLQTDPVGTRKMPL